VRDTPSDRFGSVELSSRGGINEAWRATAAAIYRMAAKTMLAPDFVQDKTFAQRFRREVRAAEAAGPLFSSELGPIRGFG
jgi:hypothetical protein